MQATVIISLKEGVLDPQGKAIEQALFNLGFSGVEGVRMGKFITLQLAETDATKAKASLQAMCDKLLANTVIEDYQITLTP